VLVYGAGDGTRTHDSLLDNNPVLGDFETQCLRDVRGFLHGIRRLVEGLITKLVGGFMRYFGCSINRLATFLIRPGSVVRVHNGPLFACQI